MHQTLRGLDPGRLERSCAERGDAIVLGTGAPGIERASVRLVSGGFSRHRHDTYAVGITTAGVQSFWYRGARRTCLPGRLHVLHPDELHDGGPATAAGFAYRIVYVEPELVRQALGGVASLPFVADPVPPPDPAGHPVVQLLAEIDEPLGELGRDAAAAAVAAALQAWSGERLPDSGPIDLAACERVREHLAAHAHEPTASAELERIAGIDRFTLARQFRRAFGTSPDRYRTMRRLERARAAIAGGMPLASAAADAGFADQSHMTRQFRRAYGMTPGRFARCCAQDARGATRPHS
jgi:AraC-like DNA-binding protein